MRELPKGWIETTLGEVSVWGSGGTPSRSNSAYFGGSIPWVTISDLNDGVVSCSAATITELGLENSSAKLAPVGSILVALYGSIGKLGIAGVPMTTNQAIAYSFPNNRGFDSRYLFHYLQSERGGLHALGSGVTQKNIYLGDLKSFGLPLAPFAEQSRIVAKLDELLTDLDAGVAELKAAQKKLAQYRQALLKAAVEGALTAEWRAQNPATETGAQLLERILKERRTRWEARQSAKFAVHGKTPPKDWQKGYPEPLRLDTSGLPELPEGWGWATVDQLSELVTSGSRGWAEYYSDAGATFIRSQNINKDWLDLTDIAFVRVPPSAEGLRTRVQKDDVLLTITGANVGKVARVVSELGDAYVSQHVALIRLTYSAISEFLHLFLTTIAGGRGQLNRQAYGAGKPGLNLQQVASVHVPLPGPKETPEILQALAVQLEAVTAQERAISTALKQSKAQRQNILRAAFSGQLVPQDPNDEPASVLLERIRAERAAPHGEKKPRATKPRSQP